MMTNIKRDILVIHYKAENGIAPTYDIVVIQIHGKNTKTNYYKIPNEIENEAA